MDRVVYVVSDLHLGPGRRPDGELDPLEDFNAGEEFASFVDQIGRRSDPVELVIAGDFLEYCQILPELGLASPEDELGCSEAESLQRTRVVLGYDPTTFSGHPIVFAALRRFMMEGHSITIIAGNHDIDLLWSRVWALIFDAIYPPGASGDLRLAAYSYTVGRGSHGRVFIEHGHEHDRANRFGDLMTRPFAIDHTGLRRLKRCWGTLFVDKVYNQLEQERWFIDNIKPIMRVVKIGLRHDMRFTALAIGLVVRFLITNGLPPLLGGAAPVSDRAEQPLDLDALVATIRDPDLAAALQHHLANPEGRQAVSQTLQGLEGSVAVALSSGGMSLSLDEQLPMATGDLLLGGAAAEDEYRAAARATLESDPSISSVVMGHTHVPLDGYKNPINLTDGREVYLFNTGTWTMHLKDELQRSYSWEELADPANYTAQFTYVRLDPDGQGGYRPHLGSWQEDLQAQREP